MLLLPGKREMKTIKSLVVISVLAIPTLMACVVTSSNADGGYESAEGPGTDPSGYEHVDEALSSTGVAEVDDEECRWRAVLSSVYEEDGPGAVAIVSREGQTIFHDAIGMADVELGVSLRKDHILRLASVTKQYTAAAILTLVDDGELSLEDTVGDLLDYPQGDVTVHQLLNHTSGIKSYTSIPGYMSDERVRRELTTKELIEVFVNEEPTFEPGTSWLYNNSGYILLGAIIEKITREPWHDFVRERLLLPLGIEQTDYYPDRAIAKGRVSGYQRGEVITNASWISMTQPHAAGALSGTAADVDRWQRALHGGEVLPERLLERMRMPDDTSRGVMGDASLGRPPALRYIKLAEIPQRSVSKSRLAFTRGHNA